MRARTDLRGGSERLARNTPIARFRNQVVRANRVFAKIHVIEFHECKMHVLLLAFANMLSQKCFSFASFRKYDFAVFRNVSRSFAIIVSQGFANSLSKRFTSAKIHLFRNWLMDSLDPA